MTPSATIGAERMPPALYIENWADWWAAVTPRGTGIDLCTIVLSGLLAWLLVRALRRATHEALRLEGHAAAHGRLPRAGGDAAGAPQAGEGGGAGAAAQPTAPTMAPPMAFPTARAVRASVLFGRRSVDGVLFPLLWLLLLHMARMALLNWLVPATPLLRVAIPALVALFAIRSGVMVLRAAFPDVPLVRSLERSISWGVWMGWVLWVSGVLPRVMAFLDTISWKVGGSRMSVATLIEGTLTAGALMLLALWVSSLLEARLLQSATGTVLSVRKGIANATRAVMVLIGLLLGLSAVGIDLTALSVMGGALGVGIGLGLQKLAANYVSGFMVLAERSVRIGDLVRVGGFEGRIADIRTRYTVIRSTAGVEAIVPNETLMTSTVENLSFSDTRMYQSTTVSVAYDSDAQAVQRLLVEAALQCPRVLREPPPSALLAGFGADGLDFTVGYWLGDPENGLGGPRSQVNMAILAALRAKGIDIPYPQRVIHAAPVAAAAAVAASAQAADGASNTIAASA